MKRKPKEALLIFARYPEAGKVKTRLAEGAGEHLALTTYAGMLLETLALGIGQLKKRRAVTVWISPAEAIDPFRRYWAPQFSLMPQAEGDLGVKLAAAFEETFRQGVKKAVVIGSDCPDLREKHLEEAFLALDDAPAVLGPAQDGGYYLLGLSRMIPSIFKGIAWGTEQVLDQTLERLGKLGICPALLEVLRDVDRVEDLGVLKAKTEKGKA
jgi:rSAM/selenodomain-associated transferase 1